MTATHFSFSLLFFLEKVGGKESQKLKCGAPHHPLSSLGGNAESPGSVGTGVERKVTAMGAEFQGKSLKF